MDEAPQKVEKPDYLGHRQRLRDRFLNAGGDSLADYELLELLLFQALPRRDTKPVAKALLRRFGTFAAVLQAERREIERIPGIGPSVAIALKVVREAAGRLAQQEVLDQPVIGSWDRLIKYLRTVMAHERNEHFRILFLNTKNALIADEVQQRGTVNHTPVYPREVIKRALELGATGIIMVHNHPSGDPTPSAADIEMTTEILEAGRKLGVTLHDHVIIARGGHNSFRTMGLI